MKAIFPGSCVVCGVDFVRGEEIVDSGLRGPRGGKKMAHLGCASRGNPYPRPGGMAIPGDYPDWTYQTGPDHVLANWTSYPQYSYESFYRTNPEHPEVPVLLQRMAQIEAELQGVPQYSDAWFELQGEHNMLDRRVRLLRSGVKLNPSAAAAHPVYWKMPQNAGPYEPVLFPYGQRGRPAVYSTAPKKAKRNRGGFRRGPQGGYSELERASLPSSAFLKPSTRSWPVSDRKHAKIALQYMMRGFGKPSEYPMLVRRLAEHYPPEDSANRSIWTMYRKNFDAIEEKAGRKMPSPRSLRRMAAAANPRRRRRRKKR